MNISTNKIMEIFHTICQYHYEKGCDITGDSGIRLTRASKNGMIDYDEAAAILDECMSDRSVADEIKYQWLYGSTTKH